jgi:hypothetical protein
MSGAVFTLGNSVSGSLSLGSTLSKFGRVAGEAGFTIEQDEETLNNTVTSRYAGLAAVTVSGVTSVLNPSLVLIPSAYNTSGSTGILYSLHSKPNGVADFVVTRATDATRFNSVGKISTVGSGDARLDYYTSGGTAGTPALLVEPSGTNLALQSEDFTTTWTQTNITISTNVTGTLSPAGGTTADKIIPTSGNLQHRVDQSITLTASGTYTFSVFAKADGYGFASLRIGSNGAAFNLSNGNTGAISSGITAQADNYGGGWYRLSITGTSASGSVTFRINVESALQVAIDFAGDGTSGILLYGAQLETGSVATSYIPTTTASATRNADNISLSGAVSGCIGQTEGTIYAEVDLRALSVARSIFSVSLNSNTTDFAAFQINSSNRLLARIRSNTGTSQDVTASSTVTGTTKIAMAYDSSGSVLVVNGAIIGTNASGIPSWASGVNFVHVGNGPSGASGSNQGAFFNDRIRAAALYTTRLTNAELTALTTL